MTFQHKNKARRTQTEFVLTEDDRKKLQSLEPMDNWIYQVYTLIFNIEILCTYGL